MPDIRDLPIMTETDAKARMRKSAERYIAAIS